MTGALFCMKSSNHVPDFHRLLDVLRRKQTASPVLFEFIIAPVHLKRLAGERWIEQKTRADSLVNTAEGFRAGGYDYAVVAPWDLGLMQFATTARESISSIGMAHGGVITDRASFESYKWPDPQRDDWSFLEEAHSRIPEGMKLLVPSYGGVLENLTSLMGFEELCMVLYDDPALLAEIAGAIGTRLCRYYERAMESDLVGGIIVNDDWGFKTQTFLSFDQMQEFIIPWHRKIVALAHSHGRPAILHSCGQLAQLWESIIEDIGYDGKHSYEDLILPPEEAIVKYGSRIAILGGMDVDFLCRSTPDEVFCRAKKLIQLGRENGGCYALGSGNSIAKYVPASNFDALREAASDCQL